VIDEPVRGGFPDPSFFSLPGLEQVRAAQRNLTPRPPISHLLGIALTQAGPGAATASMPAAPWSVDSPAGTAGLVVLMEVAMRGVALTGALAGQQADTATMTTNYLRQPTRDAGAFVARARVVHSGRTYTLVEAVVEDSSGRSLAQSSASILLRPIVPPPPRLAAPLHPVAAPVYPSPDPYARRLPEWNIDPSADPLAVMRDLMVAEAHLPGWLQLFGVRVVGVDEGRVAAVMPASEWFCDLRRTVAPGAIAYLALTAVNGAAVTVARAGQITGVLSAHLTFLRPVVPDGRLLSARGAVTHHAENLVVSSVEVSDGDGTRVALGQLSAVLRRYQPHGEPAERLLATVLFTDIVDSTAHAERLGDAGWHELLSRHHALVRSELSTFQGREIKTTGDGFLATFDSPGRAVQCARAIRDGVGRLGLGVRVGIHTGECELSGADVAGIAVHIASRIQCLAAPGEILVSGTVRDLVAGSGLPFEDRGRHVLKGIEGEWPAFAVTV
jgi:uncharacterized protein (TIGR00369 family)